jgi:hypothetical protein
MQTIELGTLGGYDDNANSGIDNHPKGEIDNSTIKIIDIDSDGVIINQPAG